ncbi:7 transmembrane receptor [Dictyocaulus viviparus]|uniref:7 transmembrane receptor n=1 Tax=Dictyocaulus viviparus TaxID=29172 RepID=A0A0D8YBK0_DICVI|nr:7 transmembrane receptor [Dictyocaulus viviparus]
MFKLILIDYMLSAPVDNQYPPPPLIGAPFAQTAIPYSILFVVGTLGNTAVLAYVFFITRSLKSSVTALGNTFVYIVALCAVDLLVTVSIPFSLSNTILNNWVFGEIGCKLHWAVELSNKIHQMRQTIFITSFLALLSIALILPVVFSATVRSFTGLGQYVTHKKEAYNIVKYMCVDGMRRDVKLLVVGFLVAFAFVLPGSLLTFFYTKIVLRLRHQRRTMLQSRIPIRRITIYTMVVTLFYLSCQIPFWLPQIYGIWTELKFQYYSHLLPFVSASFNWIFYARLNSQFKKGLVLVTERLIRKRTKSLQNGTLRDCDLDELALDFGSKSCVDGVLTICPNCESHLHTRPNLEYLVNEGG